MKIGFSGTEQGMTISQRKAFEGLMHVPYAITEFHHGDCVGADAEAHEIVLRLAPKIKIIVHPPLNLDKRAFCNSCNSSSTVEILDSKPYLARNRDIATACDTLVITPKESFEVLRSGTWSTYRYAKKLGRGIIIFKPGY